MIHLTILKPYFKGMRYNIYKSGIHTNALVWYETNWNCKYHGHTSKVPFCYCPLLKSHLDHPFRFRLPLVVFRTYSATCSTGLYAVSPPVQEVIWEVKFRSEFFFFFFFVFLFFGPFLQHSPRRVVPPPVVLVFGGVFLTTPASVPPDPNGNTHSVLNKVIPAHHHHCDTSIHTLLQSEARPYRYFVVTPGRAFDRGFGIPTRNLSRSDEQIRPRRLAAPPPATNIHWSLSESTGIPENRYYYWKKNKNKKQYEWTN